MASSEVNEPKAPAPRMSTAARADAMAVEDVIRLASEGRLRMPSFQRAFRWEFEDRRALLDSIYRGYPVGTLLLWKNPPSGTQAGRTLGAAGPPQPGDQYLVVDGQQRLTTLWDALGRPPTRGERALVFDIEREEVLSRALTPDEIEGRPPSPDDDGLPPVPLHLVHDAASLSAWGPSWISLEDKRRYVELGTARHDASRVLLVERLDEQCRRTADAHVRQRRQRHVLADHAAKAVHNRRQIR